MDGLEIDNSGAQPGVSQSDTLPEAGKQIVLTRVVCVVLAVLVLMVFGQTLRFQFVNYDDDTYVYDNPAIVKGLTGEGLVWAFTHVHSLNWHPLTTMSHMADCSIYALEPRGHHMTNVVLQAAAAILLFLALKELTMGSDRRREGTKNKRPGGSPRHGESVHRLTRRVSDRPSPLWLCAFVAAVFAIHPQRAESVAWVAERKDVLSGVFFMLTLWAYARYARSEQHLVSRYLITLFFFALGLLCKPTLVPLPFLLLLLDYWPLRRWQKTRLRTATARQAEGRGQRAVGSGPWFATANPSVGGSIVRSLVIEKIPFFVLSAASCVATVLAQTEALNETTIPISYRISNALVSYALYLWQMIWPVNLAVLYPYPARGIPLWEVAIALMVLVAISAVAYFLRRKQPWFVVGWLWYVGMLVPVIGLVQVGSQARADRYTYLPEIGLYVLMTWSVTDVLAGRRLGRAALAVTGSGVLAALVLCARKQAAYWHDSELLWSHTLDCTTDNYMPHNNLGNALLVRGDVDGAIAHYRKALGYKHDFALASYNLGTALMDKGRADEAIAYFEKALEIRPKYAEAEINLGNALLLKRQVDEAVRHFRACLEIKPDYAQAYNNLGSVLLEQGKTKEAIADFKKALELKPDLAEAHNNFGSVLLKLGEVDPAIAQFQQALESKPQFAEAQNGLGIAALQKGQTDQAMIHFEKAVELKPGYAEAHNNLANTLLQEGHADEAIAHYRRAVAIQPDYAEAHNGLGLAFVKKGQLDEAILHFQKALEVKPDYAKADFNLGLAFAQKGDLDQAIAYYKKALTIRPDYAEAHYNLGNIFWQTGRTAEAIAEFEKAVAEKPDYAEAQYNLGCALLQIGKRDEAFAHFERALASQPSNAAMRNDLAWLLATSADAKQRDGIKAVEFGQKANELSGGNNPSTLDTLAAAYAERGDFDGAIATATRALELAQKSGNRELQTEIEQRLELYRQKKPYRQPAPAKR